MIRLIFPLIAVLIGLPALAQIVVPPIGPDPQKGGVAARGELIAKRWCAECHLVAPGQTTAKVDVPSFAAIAGHTDAAARLERFLMNPHPKMPDMQIGRPEAADLSVYIMSLR
jgi:mono/diheme cytochrome c family protein